MDGRIVYLSDVPPSEGVQLFADAPDVMDVRRVAALLGVVPATVRREIARGSLECFHVGTNVRITKKQLIAYIEGGNA